MAILKRLDGTDIIEYDNVYDLELKIKLRMIDSLENADLSHIDIEGVDFRGYNMRGASLEGADANNCNFDGAIMHNVNINGASFDKSTLRNVDLSGVNAEGTSFKDCVFKKAKMNNCLFNDCDFTHSNLEAASLSMTKFEKCLFDFASLRFTVLSSTEFSKNCKFRYCIGDGKYISSITFYPFHITIVHASNFAQDGSEDLIMVGQMQYNYNAYMSTLKETEGARLCADGYKVYDYYYGLVDGLHKYMLNIDSKTEKDFVDRYMKDFRNKWTEMTRTGVRTKEQFKPLSGEF
ncbi:pentapeptide repeat-containing protein [Campylobacter jejuni]|nr:pentapeptide repeat-containing protein [Campylobacter jejuni]